MFPFVFVHDLNIYFVTIQSFSSLPLYQRFPLSPLLSFALNLIVSFILHPLLCFWNLNLSRCVAFEMLHSSALVFFSSCHSRSPLRSLHTTRRCCAEEVPPQRNHRFLVHRYFPNLAAHEGFTLQFLSVFFFFLFPISAISNQSSSLGQFPLH